MFSRDTLFSMLFLRSLNKSICSLHMTLLVGCTALMSSTISSTTFARLEGCSAEEWIWKDKVNHMNIEVGISHPHSILRVS